MAHVRKANKGTASAVLAQFAKYPSNGEGEWSRTAAHAGRPRGIPSRIAKLTRRDQIERVIAEQTRLLKKIEVQIPVETSETKLRRLMQTAETKRHILTRCQWELRTL